jgi:hypothetical protein
MWDAIFCNILPFALYRPSSRCLCDRTGEVSAECRRTVCGGRALANRAHLLLKDLICRVPNFVAGTVVCATSPRSVPQSTSPSSVPIRSRYANGTARTGKGVPRSLAGVVIAAQNRRKLPKARRGGFIIYPSLPPSRSCRSAMARTRKLEEGSGD